MRPPAAEAAVASDRPDRGLESARRRGPSSQINLPSTSARELQAFGLDAPASARNIPPPSRARLREVHQRPSQRKSVSALRTSITGARSAPARSSAATAPEGDPTIGAKARPPSSTRKTPADVTRIGERYGAPKTATGDPAGGSGGACQRRPPSRESRTPDEEAKIRIVSPAAPRNAASDPAGGSVSSETRRTFVPSATQTPLSSPPYAR